MRCRRGRLNICGCLLAWSLVGGHLPWNAVCHGDQNERAVELEREAPARESQGIVAEYVITANAPSSQATGTLFVRYLVTQDRWAMIVDGYSPYWLTLPFGLAAGNTVIFDGKKLVHRRRGPREPVHVSLTDIEKESWDQTAARGLAFSGLRASIWQLPESVASQLLQPDDHTEQSAEAQREFAGGLLSIRSKSLSLEASSGSERVEVRQENAGGGWLRMSRLTPMTCRQTEWLLPTTAFLQNGRARFVAWGDELRVPPTDPLSQKNSVSGPPSERLSAVQGRVYGGMGAGGRHASLQWDLSRSLPVPATIQVSLGRQPTGMFLRSTQLIAAEILPAAAVEKMLDNVQVIDTAIDEPWYAVSTLLWKTYRPALTSEQGDAMVEAERYLEHEAATADTLGRRQMALHRLVRMAVCMDDSDNRVLFVKRLNAYLDALLVLKCPEAWLASIFNLQDMLVAWQREDLLPYVWRTARVRAAAIDYPARLSVLIGAENGYRADDLHAVLLLDAIDEAALDQTASHLVIAAVLQTLQKRTRHLANAQRETYYPEPIPEELQFQQRCLRSAQRLAETNDPALRAVGSEISKILKLAVNP